MSKIHITLPSGHWWELETRPRWKHIIQWHDSTPDLLERALASLTIAWSFSDDITPEAIARRHEDDMLAILDAFQRHVAPQLQAPNPKQAAQGLFAALLAGHIPPAFAEVHLMAATGWNWHTLQDTPADIVNKMAIYMAVTHAINTQGTVDFHDERG